MYDLNYQITDFLLCSLIGFPIGFLHDTFFTRRILKRKVRELLFFIFCIISTIFTVLMLYFINYYEIKWYTFFAIAMGIYLYKKSISILFRKLLIAVNKLATLKNK